MYNNKHEIEPRIRHANYFATEPGQYWGFRTIPDFELILIVDGKFEYIDEKQSLDLNENDILCIPPDTEHKFLSKSEGCFISCIHFDWIKSENGESISCTPEPYPLLLTQPENPDLFGQLFKEIASDFQKYTIAKYHIACVMFKTLWIKLSEYWQMSENAQVSQKVQTMLDYIKKNIFDEIDRNSIAAHFGYTPEYINYLFKKELSLTPTQFINREKIFIAFEMLQNREGTIRQISEKLNFYDQYHFSKLFKRIMGNPPSHFKSQG